MLACVAGIAPVVWGRRPRVWLPAAIAWSVSFVGTVWPLVVSQLLHWDLIQGRYASMSVFAQPHWPVAFLVGYSRHFDPSALFFDGLSGGLDVMPNGVGELSWLEWPLLFAAVVGLARGVSTGGRVAMRVSLIAAGWVLTFPVASALTTSDLPHEIRSYNLLPLPELLSGYGAVVVWAALSRHRWRWLTAAHAALLVAVAVFVTGSGAFLWHYFRVPTLATATTGASVPYGRGLREALADVEQRAGRCDAVWVQPEVETYIYYLFDTRYPPRVIQAQQSTPERAGRKVAFVGRTGFGVPGAEAALPRPAGCDRVPGQTFFVVRAGAGVPEPTTWQEAAVVRTGSGSPVWRVLRR